MAEIRDCVTCFNVDQLPGVKCCFNCARDHDSCDVTHSCGKDCPGWVAKTNADQIRSMDDEEIASLLCSTGWRLSEQKRCLEWLMQPAEDFIK